MKVLPLVQGPLLVRTDFSDPTAWQALLAVVNAPDERGMHPNACIIDDPDFGDLTAVQVLEQASGRLPELLVVADKTAVTAPDMPLLVIFRPGTPDHDGLRVVARQLAAVTNSTFRSSNDWDALGDAADDEGVFRGFRR